MHRPSSSKVTYGNITKQAQPKLTVSVFIFACVLSLFFVKDARASFFSLFTEKNEVLELQNVSNDFNSQTMSLLKCPTSISSGAAIGGGGVHIVDGVAVDPEMAPFDTVFEDKVAPTASSDQISLYLVQNGDTLSQVAEMFGVSVSTVVWANELSSNVDIHPGQTLLILPISGVQHVIKKGDTLKGIAKKYGGDVDEIIAYNNLKKGQALAVGKTITIPGGEIEEPKHVAVAHKSSSRSKYSGPSIPGYFINPLPGSVKTQGIHGHNAVDFSDGNRRGATPVLASASGRVIVSRVGAWNGGYGNYVVIDHPNGTQTLYAHLHKNLVWQGQNVVQGQVIGYEGSTGRSTGPHLHFEVRGARNPF